MVASRAVLPDGLDSGPVARQIEREFPGVLAWYGSKTGSWWAMVSVQGRARLLEASDPAELCNAILEARGWPWPGYVQRP